MAYEGLGRKADAAASYRRALLLIERHLELNPDDSRALNLGAVAAAQLPRALQVTFIAVVAPLESTTLLADPVLGSSLFQCALATTPAVLVALTGVGLTIVAPLV